MTPVALKGERKEQFEKLKGESNREESDCERGKGERWRNDRVGS